MADDITLEGRLQMYLVLGALACADMELMGAFRADGRAIKGRQEMYEVDQFDQGKFVARAQVALENAGFSKGFRAAINWDNFDQEVWGALKTLRSKLVLMEDRYDGPDCPCMTVLVSQAIQTENTLEPLRKARVAMEAKWSKNIKNTR